MRGPLSEQAVIENALTRCGSKRAQAVRQLRAIFPQGSLSPGAEETMMQDHEANWRRTSESHIIRMREIPGFRDTNAAEK
jgi:hypothetical protein